MMSEKYSKLVEAEKKAQFLFKKIEELNLIQPGKTEKELNNEIFNLAENLFGIKKYWHKRIVRSGKNTLLPYQENPPVLMLQSNDILFFDFGPVFDEWEADFGRTYVIGEDHLMLKLKSDIEAAWLDGKTFYDQNKEVLTGAEFYKFTQELALKYGWNYGNDHCGHLVGNFPHEVLLGEDKINYIHPENTELMSSKDKFNEDRFWIYEIHFVDEQKQIGGFFEQLIS